MPQTLLTRDKIKNAKDLKHEDVDVPEWGGKIRLKQMNAGETNAFTAALATTKTKGAGMYLMLVYSARNEAGELIFTEEDLEWMVEKNIDILNILQRKALALNKMTPAGEAALKKA